MLAHCLIYKASLMQNVLVMVFKLICCLYAKVSAVILSLDKVLYLGCSSL